MSLQRSAAEKCRDEQELVSARKRERAKFAVKPPPGRHSRFGGTFTMQNVKSISDRDIICHQPLERAVAMDFDRDKNKQKRSHRVAKEEATIERRSAFSIRFVFFSFYSISKIFILLLYISFHSFSSVCNEHTNLIHTQ